MDKWEEARIDRLERKVEALEQKNRDRLWFWMQIWMYGLAAAAWVLAGITIAIHASHHS
jgi:hypothetical protein